MMKSGSPVARVRITDVSAYGRSVWRRHRRPLAEQPRFVTRMQYAGLVARAAACIPLVMLACVLAALVPLAFVCCAVAAVGWLGLMGADVMVFNLDAAVEVVVLVVRAAVHLYRSCRGIARRSLGLARVPPDVYPVNSPAARQLPDAQALVRPSSYVDPAARATLLRGVRPGTAAQKNELLRRTGRD